MFLLEFGVKGEAIQFREKYGKDSRSGNIQREANPRM
jgi:hypothetical protein